MNFNDIVNHGHYKLQFSNGGHIMDMEKIYLTMKRTGAGNIVLGILSICIGLASGIMLIITGANLLKKKKHLSF